MNQGGRTRSPVRWVLCPGWLIGPDDEKVYVGVEQLKRQIEYRPGDTIRICLPDRTYGGFSVRDRFVHPTPGPHQRRP